MKKKIKHEADQGEFLICRNCGRTWPDMDAKIKIASRGGEHPMCITCALLHTTFGHCAIEKISLHKAVGRFLKGMAETENVHLKELWKGKANGLNR